MAYFIESFKKFNFKNWKKISKKTVIHQEDKIFIFIVILSTIVITVDYALIIKFIDIIKNI
ncbi:MAG: hypothetical protein J6K42_07160 [Clostridia bacterium]|nr:hypothetical protein [Clostridia bacterium]